MKNILLLLITLASFSSVIAHQNKPDTLFYKNGINYTISYVVDENINTHFTGGAVSSSRTILYSHNSDLDSIHTYTNFIQDSVAVNIVKLFNNKLYLGTSNGIYYANNTEWPISNWAHINVTSNMYIVGLEIVEERFVAAVRNSENNVNELISYTFDSQTIQSIQIPTFYRDNYSYVDLAITEDDVYWAKEIYYSDSSQYGIYHYNNSTCNLILPNYDVKTLEMINNQLWFSSDLGLFIYNPASENLTNIIETDYFVPSMNYSKATSISFHNNKIIIRSYAQFDNCLQIINQDGSFETYNYSENYNTTSSIISFYYHNNNLYGNTIYNRMIGVYNLNNFKHFLAGFNHKNVKYLDINKIKTIGKSHGVLFNLGFDSKYTVNTTSHTANTLYSLSPFIAAKTSTGEYRASAEKYNQAYQTLDINSYEFIPGPLATIENIDSVNIDTLTCIEFDRVWKVDRKDLATHLYNQENGTSLPVSKDFTEWPANANDGFEADLAPFIDNNNDGYFNLEDGDLPEMKGDQMLWWVVNDIKPELNETNSPPMGLEVKYTLYGYKFDNPANEYEDLINYQTFLNVKITNRSQETYDSLTSGFLSIMLDGDLRDIDFGTDVERNSNYYYYGPYTYENHNVFGEAPPVSTITILDYKKNNQSVNDIYTPKLEGNMLYRGYYWDGYYDRPNLIPQYFYNLNSRWNNNTPIYYGGSGYAPVCDSPYIESKYLYPGDTDITNYGTDGVNTDEWNNTSFDYLAESLASVKSVTLAPNDEIEIDILLGTILGTGNFVENTRLFDYEPYLDSIIAWYNRDEIPSNYEALENVSINQHKINNIEIYPNPATDYINFNCDEKILTYNIYNTAGVLVKSENSNIQNTINISNLPKGAYLITFISSSTKYKSKFTKQ